MYNFATFKKENANNSSKVEESIKVNKHNNTMYDFSSFKEMEIIKESLNIDNIMILNEDATPVPGGGGAIKSTITDLLNGSDIFKDLKKNKTISAIISIAETGRAETELKKFEKKYKDLKFAKVKMQNKINIEIAKIEKQIDDPKTDDAKKEQLNKKIEQIKKVQEVNEEKLKHEESTLGMLEKELDTAISKLTGSAKDKVTTEKRQAKLAIDIAVNKYMQKLADDKLIGQLDGWDPEEIKKHMADMDNLEQSLKDADAAYDAQKQKDGAESTVIKNIMQPYLEKSANAYAKIKEWEHKKKPDDGEEYEENPGIDSNTIIKKLHLLMAYYKEIVSACCGADSTDKENWKNVNDVIKDKEIELDDDVKETDYDALMTQLDPSKKYLKKQDSQNS